jgi:hypothetical protein
MAGSARVARFIGALVLLAVAACGDERGAEPGTAGPSAALPALARLPADVPLPEDARIVEEVAARDGAIQLTLESEVPAEALLRDYRDALVKMGWTVGDETPVSGPGALAASKGTRSLALRVQDDAGGSRLVLRTGSGAP